MMRCCCHYLRVRMMAVMIEMMMEMLTRIGGGMLTSTAATVPTATNATIMQFPNVLLQIEIAAESFGTNPTCEWLFIVVRVHVEGEIVDLMKGLLANVAFVSLLRTVG